MTGEKFGLFAVEFLARRGDVEAELVKTAASLNRNIELHPEWPETYTRVSGPIFSQLERLTTTGNSAAARIEALEAFRAASMQYWLAVAPPAPSEAERSALGVLLDREDQLLTELRGAYFFILAPILPMHYRRAAMEFEPDDPSSLQYPDTSKGLDEYKRICHELDSLHTQMEPIAPEYVRNRMDATATLGSLSALLRSHQTRQ